MAAIRFRTTLIKAGIVSFEQPGASVLFQYQYTVKPERSVPNQLWRCEHLSADTADKCCEKTWRVITGMWPCIRRELVLFLFRNNLSMQPCLKTNDWKRSKFNCTYTPKKLKRLLKSASHFTQTTLLICMSWWCVQCLRQWSSPAGSLYPELCW